MKTNWEKVKINDFCYTTDYVANGSFSSLRKNVKYLNERNYAILVRAKDFTFDWTKERVYVSEHSYEFLSKSKLFPNDLIMSNVGNPGTVFIIPELGQPMTLGPNAILVRPNKDVAETKYLYYYFKSKEGIDQIGSICSATAQRKFNKTSFRDLEIPLPPLSIQKKIADALDKADRIRRKRQEAIEKFDEFVQSVFLDMFGDDGSKVSKKSKLEDISRKITDGTHQSPKFVDSGIPFLFVSNLSNNSIDFDTKKFITQKEYDYLTRNTKVELGDVLYSTVGSYGNVAVVNDKSKFLFQRHIAHIKPDLSIVNSIFLKHLLLSNYVKKQADRQVRGIAQKTLNLRELKNFEVYLPSMKKQMEFVKIVKRVKVNRNNNFSQETLSDNLFNSLMQKAFRGELEFK